MGKRAREKKAAKVAHAITTKQIIEERRKERLEPAIILAKKFAVTLAVTIILLWVGVVISGKINSILASASSGS